MRRLVARLAPALCAALLVSSGPALANGRYPAAQQLLVDPGDPQRMWLRTTYGLLISPDGGKSWSWICEAAVGYNAGEDPMMAVLTDGAVLAGASAGLFATRDHGCTWPHDEGIADRYVLDLATERDATHALALTVVVQASGANDLVVFRSTDAARTWSPLGPPISGDVAATTLDPAPSDPRRIYVTGATFRPTSALDAGADAAARDKPGASGVLLRSRDGGVSWERRAIPGTTLDDRPYIAAVDPTNPDVIYVRVRGSWDGKGRVQSWLLRTADAGDTWREIFRGDADMLGFALGADGTSVFVGLGSAHTSQRPVDPSALGIYRASAAGLARPLTDPVAGNARTFSRVFAGQVGCLTVAGASLFVCGTHATERFELGISVDDGATVSTLLDYGGIGGPLVCPRASAQANRCDEVWPSVCAALASCGAAPADAGASPAAARARGSGCSCGSPAPGPAPASSARTVKAQFDRWPGAVGPVGVALVLLAGFGQRRRKRHERGRRPHS